MRWGEMGVIKKWIKIFTTNLFRSAHYLNLQPQQPLRLHCCPSFSPLPNMLPSHPFTRFFFTIVLPLSLVLSLSLIFTLSFSFEFPWADVSARVLTASSPHNWARGGGLDLWERLEVLAQFLGGKKDFRSLSLFLSFSPSLAFVWLLSVIFGAWPHVCTWGVMGVVTEGSWRERDGGWLSLKNRGIESKEMLGWWR